MRDLCNIPSIAATSCVVPFFSKTLLSLDSGVDELLCDIIVSQLLCVPLGAYIDGGRQTDMLAMPEIATHIPLSDLKHFVS